MDLVSQGWVHIKGILENKIEEYTRAVMSSKKPMGELALKRERVQAYKEIINLIEGIYDRWKEKVKKEDSNV